MKNNNKTLITIVAVTLLMALSFVAGRSSSKGIVTEAKAATIEPNAMMQTSTVSYEKVYAYGHTFILFKCNSGDFEVVCID